MAIRQYPVIAREGWPFILVVLLLAIAAVRIGGILLVVPVLVLLVLLILLFRDPYRNVPARPLGIVAPVDGRVISIAPTDKGALERESLRIVLRVFHSGAYTARSPVEGKVLNLRDNLAAGSRLLGISGLWVRTDEGEDVVTLIRGGSWIARPRSFVGYGERLGQGQRFAFIRLAKIVEVFVPITARLQVKKGARVRAGADVLADLASG